MKLRPAQPADLPDLLLLEQRCFPGDAWSLPMLSEEIGRTGTILLVAEADSVVGYALGWVLLDELQVLRLAVLPTLRRQGQGRQLLHALEAASGASDSWLEVRDDNVAAIALYERTGYTQISRRPRYYHDGCAARIYKKGLGLYPSPS